MSRESTFNIITGEVKANYPLNSTSRRFASHSEMKRAKDLGDYNYQMPQIRRLGTSSDDKAFQYDYGSKQTKPTKTISHSESMKDPGRTSLINASKLGYNLINHSEAYAPPA